MKKAKIAELKNNLSRYIDHVREGGSVLVFDRTILWHRSSRCRTENGQAEAVMGVCFAWNGGD